MKLELLHDADLHRNRLLRAAAQLLTNPPSDPVLGEFLFASSGASIGASHWQVWDNIAGQNSLWSILGGINRNEALSGLWRFDPTVRSPGTADGSKAPFEVGSNSAFDSGGILRNWVQNLNADYVDGRNTLEYVGTSAPATGFTIPVYSTSGQLAVNDPVNDYDAINKKTWAAGLTGIVVLAPCRVATTVRFAGVRSTNVITAGSVGAVVIDGVVVIVGDRILLKDQQSGGTAIDNGVYTLTRLGDGATTAQLTRAVDADATGELTVGSMVFISEGTANRATQRTCQKAPGITGTVININVEEQYWQLSFQQSAYTEGRGIKFNGLQINFCQATDYTQGSIFYANAGTTVVPLVPPTAALTNASLFYNQGTKAPNWRNIVIADISDFGTVIRPAGANTALYHARFSSIDVNKIENSLVFDRNQAQVGPSVCGEHNQIADPWTSLGDEGYPWLSTWTNSLRLKSNPGLDAAPTVLLGFDGVSDTNGNHRDTRAFNAAKVKTFLNYTPADINGVPTSRTLGIFGTAGQIAVATQNTWDLTADRQWTLSLDFSTLDTRWMTLHTDQSASGAKTWYSVTSSAADTKLAMSVAQGSTPTWTLTTGGAATWGDGVAAPSATIDFASNRLRFSGKPVEFAATAIIRATSAISAAGTPISLLGLTAADDVQRVTASDLSTFLGQPTLAYHAVGYGDAANKLTGDAANFYWDLGNKRLGLKNAAPAETLDMVGAFKLVNTVTSGTLPGTSLTVTDNSNVNADWTSRTMIGQSLVLTKNGTANFVTSGSMEGQRLQVACTGGSLTSLFGFRVNIAAGNAGAGASVSSITGFYCQPTGATGTVGTITALYQFAAADIVAPFPQPATHYGFRCVNLTSGAGATRTAATSLELSSTGTGERFNIYAPGTAPNHLTGNLGLGVTAPTARLELGLGSTILAPARFGATSTSANLLTTPIAGALESRGDHLTFTDTQATAIRHLLAHMDDVNFTNDPAADSAGALNFSNTDSVIADCVPEIIGTQPYSIWVRIMVPLVFRGPSYDNIIALHDITGSAGVQGYNASISLKIDGSGKLRVENSADAGNVTRFISTPSFITAYAGKGVDVVVVRSVGDTIPLVYVDGVLFAGTETGNAGTRVPWTAAIQSKRCTLGNSYSTQGSIGRMYRAAVFNRSLSATEVLNLSRYGIEEMDRWGSMVPIKSYNFATDSPPTSNDGANITAVGNQTVNGSPGWVTATRNTSTGRMDLTIQNTGATGVRRRWGYRGTFWVAAATPSHFGGSVGGSVTDSGPKAAVTPSTETDIAVFIGNGANQFATPQLRIEPGTSPATTGAVTFAVGTTYSFKALSIIAAGAIVDFDLGIGCGSVIPDRSGRYHGTINGANWTHLNPTCPTEITQGPGTISRNLRRYTETITAKDTDIKTVTHSLGTLNVSVAVWDQNGNSVNVAVARKTGNLTNALDIGFALVGAPTTPIPFTVVVIG